MAKAKHPIPEGLHTLTPHLTVKGAAQAIDFYKKAFGAIEKARMAGPNGLIMHASLRIGDSAFFLNDEFPGPQGSTGPATLGGTAVILNLEVEDLTGAEVSEIRQVIDDPYDPAPVVCMIAPDLPGFGGSVDGPAVGPREHAEILAAWADALSIRSAIWIGHSFGCNAVAQLHRVRPDLVRDVICFGPLWSARSPLRLFGSLFVDAFREPFALFGYVIRAYWRAGLGRWFATFRRYRDDLRRDPPSNARMIAGRNDSLIDRDRIAGLVFIPGAHACHFAYPEEAASVAIGLAPEEILGSVSDHQDDQSDRQRHDRDDPLPGATRDAQ